MGRNYELKIVGRLPDYYKFNECTMGSFALTALRTRYVTPNNAYNYNGITETVGYHYRDFIQSTGVRFPIKGAPDEVLTYPFYARPASLPNACYIDIRHAFQTIAMRYGMDVWFKEGKAIGYGDTLPETDLFNEIKVARGLLITAHAKQGSYTQWKDNTLTIKRFPNDYYAPYMRYAIWRTLHCIMSQIKPFSYYIHTDGAIVNTGLLSRVEKILDKWHVSYSIKHTGQCHIKGVGAFSIGDFQTETFKLRTLKKSGDNILSDDKDNWWLRAFTQRLTAR